MEQTNPLPPEQRSLMVDSIRRLMESGKEENIKAAKKIQDSLDEQGIKVPLTNPETEEVLKKFITSDPDMLAMKDEVRLLSSENDPVLIQGESGTGKEIIARALHGHRSGKFIPLNCTSLPPELLESILFGHMKGSFTGAHDTKLGILKAAWKGTVFLDEIGDMPMHLQAKLLRVIQEMKILPVGSNEYDDINCRFICATHQDLTDEKRFRQDLYWRLSVFTLRTKPLRERPQDIEPIIRSLDSTFPIDKVLKYDSTNTSVTQWPSLYGNVRQLQSIVRRWKVLGKV